MAIAGVLLLHVPPGVPLLSALVPLVHALNVPVIASGDGFKVTVAVLVLAQPVLGNVADTV